MKVRNQKNRIRIFDQNRFLISEEVAHALGIKPDTISNRINKKAGKNTTESFNTIKVWNKVYKKNYRERLKVRFKNDI